MKLKKRRNSALRYQVMRGPCIISASSIGGGAWFAIRRWPREVILRDEQVWSNGNFGPLKNIPMPPKPLSLCGTSLRLRTVVYYCVEINQRVRISP